MKELYDEQNGKIRTIIINRPEKLNAMTYEMEHELSRILEEVRRDPNTSVVVIKGLGRSFSAGHDLYEVETNKKTNTREAYAIQSATGDERRRGFRQLDEWFSLLWELPQPVIAQVHGHCFNYALELAMNCDFVFAADDARFIHRPVGGAARLFNLWPWLIGPRKTKEYSMLGQACTGVDAERLGMINRSVPEAELEGVVQEFAERLAQVPVELLSLDKKAVNVCFEMMNIRAALGYTMELHAISHLTEASQDLAKKVKTDGWRNAWEERDTTRYAVPGEAN